MARVPLTSLFSSDQIVISGDEEDAGYRELMDSLAKEPTPWKALCEAIRHGDEAMIREESLHVAGAQTLAAKREAIMIGRPDLLKILLERDQYIEESVVAAACEQKDRDCVRLLLDFGWPINNPVYSTASLLSIAIHDSEFTKWLIEAGADVNARNRLNESALSIAIAHGSMDVVRLLLAQGTDVTDGDVVHCAAQRQPHLEGAELVEELVKRGADVNAYRYLNPVASGWRIMSTLLTPLHVACKERNIPVAETLLKHGADPDRKLLSAGTPAEPTPFDTALETKDQGLINLLQAYSLRDRALL